MAQVMTDTQLEMPEKRTGLIGLEDWLRRGDESEAQAEGARLAEEPARKKSKKATNRIEATAIVTGRPTTNNGHDGNDLISYARPTSPTKVDLCGKNWVGLVVEYYQAHPNHPSPTYTESSPGLNLYTCLVTISERPSPLGDPQTIFTRKKDAKQYAAKLAIEWLIANGYMPSDGNVTFPKARPLPPAPKPKPKPSSASGSASNNPAEPANNNDDDESAATTGNGEPASAAPSYPQRVVSLCASLALCPPTYKLTHNPDFEAMYSGYAVFENSPQVVGRVGEFSNVFGKRNARETCAERVVRFLEGIARDRRDRTGRGGTGTAGMGGGEGGGGGGEKGDGERERDKGERRLVDL